MDKRRKIFLIETAANKRMELLSKKYTPNYQLNDAEVEELRFLDLILDILMPSVTENEIDNLVKLNLKVGLYPYFNKE